MFRIVLDKLQNGFSAESSVSSMSVSSCGFQWTMGFVPPVTTMTFPAKAGMSFSGSKLFPPNMLNRFTADATSVIRPGSKGMTCGESVKISRTD